MTIPWRTVGALFWAALLCSGCDVDETGYLAPDEIDHTGPEPLDEDEEDDEVIVVGEDGAVEKTGGELRAENLRTGEVVTQVVGNPAGSFVLTIDGRLGDTLVLGYDLDGMDEVELALEDDLGSVATPECLPCTGSLVGPPDQDGRSMVDLSQLNVTDETLIVFNRESGSTLRAQKSDGVILIEAAVGDEVCIYARAADDQTRSPANCAAVPSP